MYWAGTGRAEVGATVMARSSFDAAPWTSLRASQRPIWFNRMCHLEDWSGYVLALMWPQAEPTPHLGVVPHRPAKAHLPAHLEPSPPTTCPTPPSSINLPTTLSASASATKVATSPPSSSKCFHAACNRSSMCAAATAAVSTASTRRDGAQAAQWCYCC